MALKTTEKTSRLDNIPGSYINFLFKHAKLATNSAAIVSEGGIKYKFK